MLEDFVHIKLPFRVRGSTLEDLPSLMHSSHSSSMVLVRNEHLLLWQTYTIEPRKTLLTFHYTGCLREILIMVYYNPHISGKDLPWFIGWNMLTSNFPGVETTLTWKFSPTKLPWKLLSFPRCINNISLGELVSILNLNFRVFRVDSFTKPQFKVTSAEVCYNLPTYL